MDAVPNALEQERKAKLRRVAIISLAVIAVVTAGFFTAKPAYRVFTGWRAKRLAAQAEQLLAERKQKPALEKAQSAFLLRRTEPAAVRAMARVLTAATNAAGLQYWQYLISTGSATEEERRTCVELAIRTRSLGLAADQLRRLLAAGPNQPANLWLASQLFAALGDYSQTVYFATRAQMHEPANKQYQVFLSSLLFDASDAGQRAQARERLWALAHDAGPMGLEALGFLARRQDLSPGQRQQLIELLKKHPQTGFSEQLLALDQRIQLEPGRRAEILNQAVTDYKSSGVENLSEFAVWLNQREEFQRTLDAVPLEAALKRKELFLPHMDALASLGRWEELDRILDTRPAPLDPVYLEAFRARSAMQMKNETAAAMHWGRALWNAERKPEQLTWLAVYAEKCGAFDPAKRSLRRLIACVEEVRPPFRALEELTARSGTTSELRDLLNEMLNRWPKDPALRNDHAYLNLLLETKLSESRQTAEELVGEFPESLPYRTTLALACLRLKDYTAALRVYEGREYDWRQALPGNRAVYAAVLAANGKDQQAREHVVSIPAQRLREEELELIRPVL